MMVYLSLWFHIRSMPPYARPYWNANCHTLCSYLSYIQFLRKLVQNRAVGILILFNYWCYQSDKFVPEFQVVKPRACILRISLGFITIHLKFCVVQLIAVFKQKLICGPQASLHTVLHNCARPWWGGQLLNLQQQVSSTNKQTSVPYFHPEECNRGQQIHSGFQILQFFRAAGREIVSVHRQVYSQGVVQGVQQLDKSFFL